MRKFFAALLAIAMIFTLCACGKGGNEDEDRDCGVYITVEASDIYAVSYGTSQGSESCQNADGSAIEAGTVIHFDFAGDAAENSEKAIIDYSICAYDANLDFIADNSFSDDFSNMAKVNLVITEDHHILYDGQEYSCGGDIIVSYTDSAPASDISLMSATVSMASRPEVAESINGAIEGYNNTFANEQYNASKEAYEKGIADGATPAAEPFSMNRTVRVMRGDGAVLSFRMADRAKLGSSTNLTIIAHNFNTQTGEELSIKSIAKDSTKFTEYCAERVLVATTEEERFLTESMIFVDGYTDNIRNLISDGHWYFSNDGLVIAANPGDISIGFYEFVIPYADLKDYLKEEFLPAELKGSYGNVSIQPASSVDFEKLTLLGAAPEEGVNAMIITVAGNVYNINVYTGIYKADSGSFTQDRQLVYCSDMMRGAALTINRAPAEGTPDLMVSFNCPDGTLRKLLVSADSANGGLLLMDLSGGNEGVAVKGSTKYDLNGDGNDETVKIDKGSTVSVVVDKESAATDIKSDESVRLYDLNGDGLTEIYVSGALESGETVTYCFVYDGAITPLGEPVPGIVNEFNGNRLFMLAQMNVLGKHQVNTAYLFDSASGKLAPMAGFEYIFDGDAVITAAVPMALTNGTNIATGTALHLKSTDGASYVKVTADGGISGTLKIAKDTIGEWTINGQPASVCFSDIA